MRSKCPLLLTLCALLVFCACDSQRVKQENPATMNQDTIVLALPQETGATLLDALKKRASVREYSAQPLSQDQLAGVLWAAAGMNRENGKLTAPSALALYPITVYAVTAEGIYRYNSADHLLQRVASGDLRTTAGLQDFVYSAPLNLVYVADLNVYDPEKYPQISREKATVLAGLDAAGAAENVNLYAAATGLGSVTRGSYPTADFLQAAKLDPERYTVVLAQTIGIPAQ